MATRFTLAGLSNLTVSIEMKCAFKEFVNNRLLIMDVKASSAQSPLPVCELFDAKTRVSAVEHISKVAVQSYPEIVLPTRGLTQQVKVTFVHNCSRFYVQIRSKENEMLR